MLGHGFACVHEMVQGPCHENQVRELTCAYGCVCVCVLLDVQHSSDESCITHPSIKPPQVICERLCAFAGEIVEYCGTLHLELPSQVNKR